MGVWILRNLVHFQSNVKRFSLFCVYLICMRPLPDNILNHVCRLLTGILILLPVSLYARDIADPFHDPLVDQYLWNANYDNALETNSMYLELAKSNPATTLLLLLKQCDIYLVMARHKDAITILTKAADLREKLEVSVPYIDFMFALEKGIILSQQRNYVNAGQWFGSAMKLIEKAAPDPLDAARLFYEMSNMASYTMQDKQALHYCQQSIARLKGNTLAVKAAKTLYYSRLALLYYMAGAPVLSDQAFQRCDSMMKATKLTDHPVMLSAYMNYIAYSISRLDRMSTTEVYLNRLHQILKTHYPIGFYRYGQFYFYKGLYEQLNNDPEKALVYYYQAERYFSDFVPLNRLLVDLYYNKALIYSNLRKDYQKAILFYDKFLNAGNISVTKHAHVNISLGICYQKLENYPMAIEYFKKAIIQASDLSNIEKVDFYISANLNLSLVYQKLQRKELEFHCINNALETTKHHHVEKYVKAKIFKQLGEYYSLNGDLVRAIGYYQKVLGLCTEAFTDTTMFANPVFADSYMEGLMINTLSMKGYAFYLLYATNGKDINYLREALKCHEAGMTALIKVLMEMESENSEFSWDGLIHTSCNNAVSYACMLYNLTGEIGYADKALLFSEKSKMLAILISNQHNNIGKVAGIPDALVEKEMTLRNEIQHLQNRLLEDESKGIGIRVNQGLVDELTRLQIQGDTLKRMFQTKYKNYVELKYNLKVMSIREIQKKLHDDQVIIEYQLLNSEIITIVIAKHKVRLTLTPNDGKEIAHIMQLRNAVSENPFHKDPHTVYADFVASASYLFKRLLQPVFNDIIGKKLIVIPHNELNLVPFELLLTEEPDARSIPDYANLPYLLRELPVSYAYSCTLLYDQVPERKAGKNTAIFLPDYSLPHKGGEYPDLSPLEGAREEVVAIQKLVHGKVYRSTHATEREFRAAVSGYQVLHLAAHTLIDEKIPSLSSLVMSPPADSMDDGLLHSYELYQMKLRARLVVLSSCNTGYGKLQYGEGLLSLTRSFFLTGVRSVAYTQWPLVDKTGALIITGFYDGMVEGQNLEVALRAAKLGYLSVADPVKSHPYFWAGYVLVGNTDPIELSRRFPIIVWFLVIVTAGISGYWIYRRFIF